MCLIKCIHFGGQNMACGETLMPKKYWVNIKFLKYECNINRFSCEQIMHPRPWQNIPRDAIKQKSKINIAFIFATYLASFSGHKSCDQNTEPLTFSLISFTLPRFQAPWGGWASLPGGTGQVRYFEDTLRYFEIDWGYFASWGAAFTICDRSSAACPAGLPAE